MPDTGLVFQFAFAIPGQTQAVGVVDRSSEGTEQHAMRLHDSACNQFAVGGGRSDSAEIVCRVDTDGGQPLGAARANIFLAGDRFLLHSW